MSRKLGLLIVFVIAIAIAIALHLHEASSSSQTQSLLAIVSKAISFFIFPGVIPCIVWACLKFRLTYLKPVMAAWILLQLIDAAISFSGIGQQVVTGG